MDLSEFGSIAALPDEKRNVVELYGVWDAEHFRDVQRVPLLVVGPVEDALHAQLDELAGWFKTLGHRGPSQPFRRGQTRTPAAGVR